MKTEDKLLIGVGIAGLAGIAYALTKKPEEDYLKERWCAKENRYIDKVEWTTARCVAGPPSPLPEWIKEGENLQVDITDPYDGDYWWKFFGKHIISVDVTNPYNIPKKFYIYVGLFGVSNTYEYDEITLVTLEANETKTVKHIELNVSGWPDGDYHVLAAALCQPDKYIDHNHGDDLHKLMLGTSPMRSY